MTSGLTLRTFDGAPDGPRGFVQDMRLRWAFEEAGWPMRFDHCPRMQAEAGAAPYLSGMSEGWSMCLVQLAERLAV